MTIMWTYFRAGALSTTTGEVITYTAFAMLTYTPWGYVSIVVSTLILFLPNMNKIERYVFRRDCCFCIRSIVVVYRSFLP